MLSAIIISLVLGSLWWRLPLDAGLPKFGLLLFAALQIAFANMSEVPVAVVDKYTSYKHLESGFYPSMGALAPMVVGWGTGTERLTLSHTLPCSTISTLAPAAPPPSFCAPAAYAVASAVVHVPIALVESAVFSSILYFMTGLVEDASRWFYFWGMLTLVDIAMVRKVAGRKAGRKVWGA